MTEFFKWLPEKIRDAWYFYQGRGEFTGDEREFVFRRGRARITFPWSRVRQIFVWKDDLITYDEIRVEVISDQGNHTVLCQTDRGFLDFVTALTGIYPEIDPEWLASLEADTRFGQASVKTIFPVSSG